MLRHVTCFGIAMTNRLALVILIAAVGCGGRATEQTSGGASTAGSTTSGPDSGAPVVIGGLPSCAGTGTCESGQGGAPSSDAGIAGKGGGANASVLVACAPAVGGAPPRPRCTTEYTVGSMCDPTTFQICSSLSYQAEIWCGRPAICAPPAPLQSQNRCVGSCSVLNETCQWVPNLRGGGVSSYICCRDDDGGLAWVDGYDCSGPPL
jgi:hypothetical protein